MTFQNEANNEPKIVGDLTNIIIKTPCVLCGDRVIARSTSGDTVCPWCDVGKCRYCGVNGVLFKSEIDGGRSIQQWHDHMTWHRTQLQKAAE